MIEMRLLAFIIGLLILNSCDPIDKRFTIVNETDSSIVFELSPYGEMDGKCPYRKFVEVSGEDSAWVVESENLVEPNEQNKIISVSDWEFTIKDGFNDNIYIFVYDVDTLLKYSWEEVVKENRYIKRFQFNVEELNKVDWKVAVRD